jgi:hypothetical protein
VRLATNIEAIPHSNHPPVLASPYLRFQLNSAAVEAFLTRLGCSIKDGSLYANSYRGRR